MTWRGADGREHDLALANLASGAAHMTPPSRRPRQRGLHADRGRAGDGAPRGHARPGLGCPGLRAARLGRGRRQGPAHRGPALAQNFLRRELAEVFPMRWKDPTKLRVAFEGDARSLRFVSTRAAGASSGGLALVGLEVEPAADPRENNLVMRRAMPDDKAQDFGPLEGGGAHAPGRERGQRGVRLFRLGERLQRAEVVSPSGHSRGASRSSCASR